MGVGLGGRGFGGNMDLAYKQVHGEVAGNDCGVCIRKADIKFSKRAEMVEGSERISSQDRKEDCGSEINIG